MNIDELKSELEQIKDEKYNLLKLVNHDIRSPFNRIFALLQLFEMEKMEFTSLQKEYINSMYLSILSGLEMITNLRDMREIDADNIEIDKTSFDLINTIQKAIRSFSKQTEIKNLDIKIDLNIDHAPIISDEYFVQRTIENVLSNAIKFSREGKEIYIRLNNNENSYAIEIQDYGDGIKVEEEYMLYQKFKKLSSVATGGEGSLGLGLHNTTYFIKKLNGTINLQRNNLPGSSFIIDLPKE
jgi:K+-sensing histidine kinase KdpD